MRNLSDWAVGEVLENVDVRESGLIMQSNKFYVRQACKDLWEFLDSNNGNIRSVVGPPGLGKSVAVFMYAIQKAVDCRLVYIQGDAFSKRVIYGKNNEFKASKKIMKKNEILITEWLEHNIRRTDLIVVDGTDSEFIREIMEVHEHISLIICTSFAPFRLSSEQELKFDVR